MMKKTTTILVCGAIVALTGCSKRTEPSTANAFGNSALVEEISGCGEEPTMTFVYAGDTLMSIELSDEYNHWQPTTFDHDRPVYDGKTYDVRMTCNSGALGVEKVTTEFYFTVADNGFAGSAEQVDIHADGRQVRSQWTFDYTADGQLASYTYVNDQFSVDGTMQWADGDLVGSERRANVGGSQIYDKVAVHYVSSQESEPIDNVGNINIYDGRYGVSTYSIINSAYYAGLLGRSTRHLPLMTVVGEGAAAERTNYEWFFNNDGYPVRMTTVRASDDEGQTTEYAWRNFARNANPERDVALAAVDSLYVIALANEAKRQPADNRALMTPELREALEGADEAAAALGEPALDNEVWMDAPECDNPTLVSTSVLSYGPDQARARVVVRPVGKSDETRTVTLTISRTDGGTWQVSDFILPDGVSMYNLVKSLN